MAIRQKLILIEEALRFLRFEPIPVLLYLRDREEVEEFSPNSGIMISKEASSHHFRRKSGAQATMRFGYTPMVRFTNSHGVRIGKHGVWVFATPLRCVSVVRRSAFRRAERGDRIAPG